MIYIIYIIFDSFRAIANRLGLMDDEKAGVARTAYLGIVTLFWKVFSPPVFCMLGARHAASAK